MTREIETLLRRLELHVRNRTFEELETDTIEFKPVPASGSEWRERYKSVDAFLNTRGGILILGVKEQGQGPDRRYVFTGYRQEAENKIREFSGRFTTRDGRPIDLSEAFPPPQLLSFMDGQIALVYVDELSAEQKYVFLDGSAYKRELTADVQITKTEIQAHEEYKQELWHARELVVIPGASARDLDLDRINEYIQLLNRTIKVETVKASLKAARPFLDRKMFVIGEEVTTLGMLVCGKHPEDHLGFRTQLHGYVDMPRMLAQDKIIQDKQDFSDNILPLMEDGYAYLLRNIQVGVSASEGGSVRPQYPEELLRETINNALAHRDYTINRQVTISIKPGQHICIQNPGAFGRELLIEIREGSDHMLRIIPEPRPRNPKLANVLRVYRKWEGKGIGMATLVNLCLAGVIDLPYYRLRQDEVALYICAGKLLDTGMEQLLASFNAYIVRKSDGRALSEAQKQVLAYIIKSEQANRLDRHTILLTADNNHYQELARLKEYGLIFQHPASPEHYPIYLADRELLRVDYGVELRELFGGALDQLAPFYRECLNAIYRHQHYSRQGVSNAKQAAQFLWPQQGGRDDDIRGFDVFYRKARYTFNRLEKGEYIVRDKGHAFVLNERFGQERLL